MKRLFDRNQKTRRTLALTFTVFAILLFVMVPRWETIRPNDPRFFTGFTLISGVGLLMLLGLRRRLPFWPIGSASTWTQIHLYAGIFTASIYLMHVPGLIAGGSFGAFLSILFLVVTASGFYGLYASRTLPKKWTAVESDRRRAAGESVAQRQILNDSDAPLAAQTRLRIWVAFHSLLSCVLLAASIAHVVTVLRLAG